jgi:hypothetical protein
MLIASCSNASQDDSSVRQSMSIFALGDERLDVRVSKSLTQAEEDFQAVVAGKKPTFAKFDTTAPLPSDGGTTFYKGDGYDLKIVKALTEVSHTHGYLYGPVITFESRIVFGNYKEISHVTFYSTQEMHKLLDAAVQ